MRVSISIAKSASANAIPLWSRTRRKGSIDIVGITVAFITSVPEADLAEERLRYGSALAVPGYGHRQLERTHDLGPSRQHLARRQRVTAAIEKRQPEALHAGREHFGVLQLPAVVAPGIDSAAQTSVDQLVRHQVGHAVRVDVGDELDPV